MATEQYMKNIIETDVLVVGGGNAGCPLAAKAAEKGLKVLIIEKSHTERSGNLACGIDGYGMMPHGISMKELMALYYERMTYTNQGPGRWINENISYTIADNAWWGVEELERFGIPMKWDDGDYYWVPHMIMNQGLKLGIRVHWHDVKPRMTRMCLDRGVTIMNRVMLIDVLTHNGVACGGTAFDTRTGEFYIIKARAVVLANGSFSRLFEPETLQPWKYKMRYHHCPASVSGDGWAAAYRAGAGLAHMDDDSWNMRLRDDITCSFGNFVNNDGLVPNPVYWDGKMGEPKVANSFMARYQVEQKGQDPVYLTLENLPDDWHKRIEVCYVDERLVSFKLAQDRKFNPKNHRYEISNKVLQLKTLHGIWVDDNFMSPYIKGLYSAGDCAAGVGGAYGSCTSGLIIGENVGDYINSAPEPILEEEQIFRSYEMAYAPCRVKDGTEPMEFEVALRQIGDRYVSALKTEGRLLEGIRRLESLKREFLPKLMAPNPHYQMRALEARNIMEILELHLYACLQRRETRRNYVRLDYPEMDRSRDDYATINRIENGEPILERVEVPTLKPEYAEAMK